MMMMINTVGVTSLFPIFVKILSVIYVRAVSVEWFLQNPE